MTGEDVYTPRDGGHHLIKHIRIDNAAGRRAIYIDGELFPYYTQAAPITVEQKKWNLPTVWIPVVCDSVTVDSGLAWPASEEGVVVMDNVSESVDP